MMKIKDTLKRMQSEPGAIRSAISQLLSLMGRNAGITGGPRIAMIHTGRCGSTVLGNMLNKHDEIYWDSESLHPFSQRFRVMEHYRGRAPLPARLLKPEIARRFFRAREHRFGCEFKPHQMQYFSYNSPVEQRALLEQLGFSTFICLTRRNHLRKILSAIRSHVVGEFHIKANTTQRLKLDPIAVPPDRVRLFPNSSEKPIEILLEEAEAENVLAKTAAGPDCLSLVYEDHVRDGPSVGYRLLCEHLGLEPMDITPDLQRTNPIPVDQMLADPTAWRARLANTRFAWMFDAY